MTSAPAPAGTKADALTALADRVTTLRMSDIDDRGRDLIRTAFTDTLGVALAGSAFSGIPAIREAAGIGPGTEGSLILGTSERAPALDAGLLNGVAAHALDFDDSNATMGGHPSVVLVPAVLALGEETGAPASEAALAYAAGFEAIIRVSRAVNPEHYRHGWHPTSTIGVIGAAAAAARLLGLPAERTAVAMAVAVSQAAGIKANFGTMTKSFHVGQAVRHGILAAKLAAAGFTASPGALDAPQGFINVYNGTDRSFPARVTADLAASPSVNVERNIIKHYPCCHSTHGAVEAAREIHASPGFRASSGIEDIEITVAPDRIPHTNRPVLAEALSGKFSLQYVTARSLLTGAVSLSNFEGDAHLDPATLSLMKVTRVEPADPGAPARLAHALAATVRVRLPDGTTFTGTGDPLAPAANTAGAGKFADCAGRVLPPGQVAALTEALERFPSDDTTVRDLMRLAATDAAASPGGTTS